MLLTSILTNIISTLPIDYPVLSQNEIKHAFQEELKFVDFYNKEKKEQDKVKIISVTCEPNFCHASLYFPHDESTSFHVYTGVVNPENGVRAFYEISENESSRVAAVVVVLKDGQKKLYYLKETDLIAKSLASGKFSESRIDKNNVDALFDVDYYQKK
jgi:hypothetical protein